MSHRLLLRVAASLLAASAALAAAPAAAGVTSFVSGKGVDAGDCSSPATPCRTFQFALKQTAAGGEIKALDPANYFAVTINKSISIVGVEGAGVLRSTFGDAVTVAAGASDRVHLRGLSLDGFGAARVGVRIASAGTVEIANCVIRRFLGDGIRVSTTSGTMKFVVTDTRSANNFDGINVAPSDSANVTGLVQRTTLAGNTSDGLKIDGFSSPGRIDMRVVESVSEGNRFNGVDLDSGVPATLLLDRVTVSGNANGVVLAFQGVARLTRTNITGNAGTGVIATGKVESFGDNVIRGNQTNDVFGALTPVALQ